LGLFDFRELASSLRVLSLRRKIHLLITDAPIVALAVRVSVSSIADTMPRWHQ
jgi:hypothetical protein